MSSNALYNVIHDLISKNPHTIPSNIQLLQKVSSLKTPYYFFELPKEQLKIGDFTLRDHHISVNDTPLYNIDRQSQYHYTAFFINQAGQTYRLHVYFNENDKIISTPYFSMEKEDKTYETSPTDFEEVFKALALKYTKLVLPSLRQVQKNRYEDYEKQYLQLEDDCTNLSIDISKNKINYLNNLKQQLQLTENMLSYTNSLLPLHKRVRFLKSMTNAVEFHIEETDKKTEKVRKIKSKNSTSELSIFSSKAPQKPKSHKSSLVKESFDLALQEINFKLKNFVKLQSMASYKDLYDTLQEKELELEFNQYSARINEIQELKNIRDTVENKGIQLLQNLLVGHQFTLAQELKCIFNLLDNKIVLISWYKPDHVLIDFLIKNALLSIQPQEFTFSKINYHSLVEFCFKNHKDDKSYLPCLDVLVKNGASLLEIDEQSGLPYAAILLMNPKHPLAEVLKNNDELTVNNIQFLHKLNQTLKCISQHSEKVSQDVSKLIEDNQKSIERANMIDGVYTKALQKQYVEHQKHNQDLFAEELIEQLKTDPDLLRLVEKIESLFKVLLPQLTFKEQVACRQYQRGEIAASKKLIPIFKVMFPLISFETLKKLFLQDYFNIIQLGQCRLELIPLQKRLLTLNSQFRTKPSREQKQLARREQLLITDIKTTSSQLKIFKADEHLNEFNANPMAKDIINLINQLSKMENGAELINALINQYNDEENITTLSLI